MIWELISCIPNKKTKGIRKKPRWDFTRAHPSEFRRRRGLSTKNQAGDSKPCRYCVSPAKRIARRKASKLLISESTQGLTKERVLHFLYKNESKVFVAR
jgi:hypothetical protein